ncbi:MAG: LacI family DNA-binding transcriptional regulator [Telluria sp.]
MAVTIRDIAQASGVSPGTVSRALKDQPGLTPETRDRIRAIARELGYDFGQLKQRRLRRILFLVHAQHNTSAAQSFYAPVLHGAEEACRSEGIALSFAAIGPAEAVEKRVRLHTPDAIICAGFVEPEVLGALRALGLPLALVDLRLPGFASANPDHRLGGFLATQHLLRTGRRHVAFLSGSLAHYSIRERAHGFRQALFDARVLANPDYEIVLEDGLAHRDAVAAAMRTLLRLAPRPDAIFCYNDATALLAMDACCAAGLKIPHDIAIAGFDDIEAAAQARPPLTSIRVDKESLGAAGVWLLLEKPGAAPAEQVLPVQLVIRESTLDD